MVESPPQLSHRLSEALEARGDAVVLRYGGTSVTARALRESAFSIEARLLGQGLAPGDRVLVALDRTPDLVASILGSLFGGFPFVLVDPRHPRDRIEAVAKGARPAAVLADELGLANLPETGAPILSLDLGEGARAHSSALPELPAEDVAYVHYTSGSTGRPKGAVASRGGLVALLDGMASRLELEPGEVFLAWSTVGFDICLVELLLPIWTGGAIELLDEATRSSPTRTVAALESTNVHIIQGTPTRLRLLLEAGWSGGAPLRILSGGEVLTRALADRLLERCTALHNLYGPTECAVWTLSHRVRPGPSDPPLGTPFRGTGVEVVPAEGLPPDAGELFLTGAQVGLGYLDDPERTKAAFRTVNGVPKYRTGDIVRTGEGGEIQFVGREDDQVKVGGVRVELSEVEHAVSSHPDVRACVPVLPAEADALTVFVVLERDAAPPTPAGMEAHLASRLVEATRPNRYIVRESFPLTPTGKVDRRALLQDLREAGVPPAAPLTEGRAPADDIEWLVARAWREVLRVDEVPRGVSFLDLGGSSIRGFEVLLRLERRLGLDIPQAAFAVRKTVAEQADLLRSLDKESGALSGAVPLIEGDGAPPLFCMNGVQLYAGVAEALGSGQPTWGVSIPLERELYRGARGRAVVQEFAEQGEEAIRAACPEGPYRLAGVSFGGVVAYEIARRLQKAKKSVEGVVLFDAVLPHAVHRAPHRRFLSRGRKLGTAVGEWAVERSRGILHAASDELTDEGAAAKWNFAGLAGLDRYAAGNPIGGPLPVLVLRATERMEGIYARVDRDLGWSDWTDGPLVVRDVEGDHLGILEGVGARCAAKHIGEFFEMVEARPARSGAARSSPRSPAQL